MKLKYLLKAFLELSNSLSKNSKQSSGPLTSLKLSSLSELARTKTNSNMTADLYVVSRILAHVPEVLEVLNDVPSVDEARAVIFNRLVPELKKVEEGVAIMRQLKEAQTAAQIAADAASVSKDGDAVDKDDGDGSVSTSKTATVFPPTHLDRYLAESMRLFSSASRDLVDAQRDFQDLCEYFGEEALDPEGLFGLVLTFLRGIYAATTAAKMNQIKAKRVARINNSG